MKNKVELPFSEPPIRAYHRHITVSICLSGNPTLWNWYLNQVTNISCNKRFLTGFTTPTLDIENAIFHDCPYLEKWWYPMEFAKGSINVIIRELLNKGYYVYFHGVDDYYLENKTFYKERHFDHDGILYGYDQEAKTYSIYAYNNRWICSRLVISQKSFNKGRKAMFAQGMYGNIFGIKPKDLVIDFDPVRALRGIEEYLDSSVEKEPVSPEGLVYGVAVQDYLAMYLDKLLDSSIPYDRMDRRIFRLLWEHKHLMTQRIQKIEETLQLSTSVSEQYREIENEADRLRLLYAVYSMKKKDSLLMGIRNRLMALRNQENDLLNRLLVSAKDVVKL